MTNLICFGEYSQLLNIIKKTILFSGKEVNDCIDGFTDNIASQKEKPKYKELCFPILKNNSYDGITMVSNYNVGISWFECNEITNGNLDLLEDYIIPVITQNISEKLEKIRNYINTEKKNQTTLSSEFEIFCNSFVKGIQTFFTELSQNKKSISLCDNINLYQMFDWILLYCATSKSIELFSIIYEATDFRSLVDEDIELFCYIMNRKIIHKHITVIGQIIKSQILETFIEKVGMLNFWKIILYNKDPESNLLELLMSNYCEKLFKKNLFPEPNIPNYDQIIWIINNYRDKNNRNFLHYFVIYFDSNLKNSTSLNPSISTNYQETASVSNNNLEKFLVLKDLNYEQDIFGFTPIVYFGIKNVDITEKMNNTEGINNSNVLLEINRKKVNEKLSDCLMKNIFSLQDFCNLSNGISMCLFFESYTLMINNMSYFLLEQTESFINFLILNYSNNKICNVINKMIDIIKSLNEKDVLYLMEKKVSIYSDDSILKKKWPLIAVFASLNLVEKILESVSEKVDIFFTILNKNPFLFSFPVKYENNLLFVSNYTSEYSTNTIKILSKDINNFEWILLYLNSVYSPLDITNVNFFKEIIPIVYNLIESNKLSKNIDLNADKYFNTILKYITTGLLIFEKSHVDVYFEYLENIKNTDDTNNTNKFKKSLECLLEILYKYEIIDEYDVLLNKFEIIYNVFKKYATINVNIFVEIMMKNTEWFIFPNKNYGTYAKFGNCYHFLELTKLIFDQSNQSNQSDKSDQFDKLIVLNESLSFDSLKILVFQLPEIFNFLLSQNYFENAYELNKNVIDSYVETCDLENVITAMRLPNYDYSKMIAKFITGCKNENTNDNLVTLMEYIVSGFITSEENEKLFVHNGTTFPSFSKMFIECVPQMCDCLCLPDCEFPNSQSLNILLSIGNIFSKMISNQLISKKTCGEKYNEYIYSLTYDTDIIYEIVESYQRNFDRETFDKMITDLFDFENYTKEKILMLLSYTSVFVMINDNKLFQECFCRFINDLDIIDFNAIDYNKFKYTQYIDPCVNGYCEESLFLMLDKMLFDIDTIYKLFFSRKNKMSEGIYKKILDVYGFDNLLKINIVGNDGLSESSLLDSPLFCNGKTNPIIFKLITEYLLKSNTIPIDLEKKILNEILCEMVDEVNIKFTEKEIYKKCLLTVFRTLITKMHLELVSAKLINLIYENISESEQTEELIESIYDSIYDYGAMCKKKNINIVEDNVLIKMCPNVVLYCHDFKDKIKEFSFDRLLEMLLTADDCNQIDGIDGINDTINDGIDIKINTNISNITNKPKIIRSQQNIILEIIKSNGNNEELCKALSSIVMFSEFIEENYEQIKDLARQNRDVLQNLIKFENISTEILFLENSNGDFSLMLIPMKKINKKLCEKFICSMTSEKILSKNRRGNLKILHFLCDPYMEHILKRNDVATLFADKTTGSIIYTSMLESVIEKPLEEILKIIPEEIRSNNEYTDVEGNNFYMALLDATCDKVVGYNKLEIVEMIEKILIDTSNIDDKTKKLTLLRKNNDGNNLLFLSVKHSEIFKKVLNIYINFLGKDSLMEANNNFETLLMYTIKYNPENVLMLLKNKNIDVSQNYVYANTGSVITYSIVYSKNTDIFDSLIKWEYLASNYMDITQQIQLFNWHTKKYEKSHMTPISLACVYSPEIFRKIHQYYLNKKIDINLHSDFVTIGKNNYSLVELSYLYEPESFQYICGLENGNIFPTSKQLMFFIENIDVQPLSWCNFVNSKYYMKDAYTNQQLNKVTSKLRPTNILAQRIPRYVQTKNEASNTVTEICQVCEQNKKKIMFGCMQHFSCVTCCIKSEVCPFCRNNKERIKIFD